MSHLVECANKNCGKEYLTENKKTDDGYCSQDCWEEAHCSTPKESYDILDITMSSLLSA